MSYHCKKETNLGESHAFSCNKEFEKNMRTKCYRERSTLKDRGTGMT